jgi:hypothetical protein
MGVRRECDGHFMKRPRCMMRTNSGHIALKEALRLLN